MGGDTICRCPEKDIEIHDRHWRVWERKWNSGAFVVNGGERSDYSSLMCMACLHSWRSKAGYVIILKDITEEEKLDAFAHKQFVREKENE